MLEHNHYSSWLARKYPRGKSILPIRVPQFSWWDTIIIYHGPVSSQVSQGKSILPEYFNFRDGTLSIFIMVSFQASQGKSILPIRVRQLAFWGRIQCDLFYVLKWRYEEHLYIRKIKRGSLSISYCLAFHYSCTWWLSRGGGGGTQHHNEANTIIHNNVMFSITWMFVFVVEHSDSSSEAHWLSRCHRQWGALNIENICHCVSRAFSQSALSC